MSKRALRYSSEADMPESMRRLMRKKPIFVGVDHARPGGDVHTEARVMEKPGGALEIVSIRETRRNKYGNAITHVDGVRFDSKREATYYEQLKLRKIAGEVSYWLRQVPIHLPGGTRLVVDFLVFFVDPARAPEYVDVKGRETPAFRIKRREIEHHYPFRIVLA